MEVSVDCAELVVVGTGLELDGSEVEVDRIEVDADGTELEVADELSVSVGEFGAWTTLM